MLAYKFKITFEDQDDFVREIELRSDHSFEDFHHAIVSNLKLDAGMLSSFFICDHNFRKKQEISLVDMNADEQPAQDSDEDNPGPSAKVVVMKDSDLCDFIDDPHQRLMYVYDYINYWTFYIELIKIVPADKNVEYPRVTRSLGGIPREFTSVPQQVPGIDKSLEFDFDEETYDPDEVRQLEGDDAFFDEEEEGNDPGPSFEEDEL